MNSETTDTPLSEQSLVQLYMSLTGRTEANARSVFMYVNPAGEEAASGSLPPEPTSPLRPVGQ